MTHTITKRSARDANPATWTNATAVASFLLCVLGGAKCRPFTVAFAIVGLRQTKRRGQAGDSYAVFALVISALQVLVIGWSAYSQFHLTGHVDWNTLFK